jgi:hypothetical protein
LAFAVLAALILDSVGTVVSVACFAFAAPLIRQTAEVKQYSSDVAVAVLLMLLSLPSEDRSRRFDIIAGVSGAVAIWFSQPAVLVALALAVVLASEAWRSRSDRSRSESMWRATLWTVSAGIAALVAVRSMTPSTRAYMQQCWREGYNRAGAARAAARRFDAHRRPPRRRVSGANRLDAEWARMFGALQQVRRSSPRLPLVMVPNDRSRARRPCHGIASRGG